MLTYLDFQWSHFGISNCKKHCLFTWRFWCLLSWWRRRLNSFMFLTIWQLTQSIPSKIIAQNYKTSFIGLYELKRVFFSKHCPLTETHPVCKPILKLPSKLERKEKTASRGCRKTAQWKRCKVATLLFSKSLHIIWQLIFHIFRGLKDPEGARRRMEAKAAASAAMEQGGGTEGGGMKWQVNWAEERRVKTNTIRSKFDLSHSRTSL